MSYEDIQRRRLRYYRELKEVGQVSSRLEPDWDVLLPAERYQKALEKAQSAPMAPILEKQPPYPSGINAADPGDGSRLADL